MKNELWEVGPRVARYRCLPDNDEARRQLEAIGHAEFEAISIGRAGNGPQVAIIPLDESSREIAAHIVALHNAGATEIGGEWPPYWSEFTPTVGAFYWVKLYPQSPWLPAELRHGTAYGYHFKVFGEFSIAAPDRVFAVWKEPIVKPPPGDKYEATYR